MTLTDIFKACDESGIVLSFCAYPGVYAIRFERDGKTYVMRFNQHMYHEEEKNSTDVEEMTEALVRDTISHFDDLKGYSIKRKEDLEDG